MMEAASTVIEQSGHLPTPSFQLQTYARFEPHAAESLFEGVMVSNAIDAYQLAWGSLR